MTVQLDYGDTLAVLMGMVKLRVELVIRGANESLPLFLAVEGELTTSDAYGKEQAGWDADAFLIWIGGPGGALLTIHPDHFQGALHIEDEIVSILTIYMGAVELSFRTVQELTRHDG